MIHFDPNANSMLPRAGQISPQARTTGAAKADFSQAVKALGKSIAKIDDAQHAADASAQDLLVGKNNDVTAVVSAVVFWSV